MVSIEVSNDVKARLDALVADARTRADVDGEDNGMTDYSGALQWALDMAVEAAPDMAPVLHGVAATA